MLAYSSVDAKHRKQISSTGRGHAQNAAVEVLADPSPSSRDLEHGRAECAAEMRATFAPIQTGEREPSPERPRLT